MDRHELLRLAERQHSLLARAQLLEAGLSPQSAWRLAHGPDWETVTRHVIARRGAEKTTDRRLMAATLDAGPASFISHRGSAAMWKTRGYRLLHLRTVDVSRPRGGTRRPSELARIHEVLDLGPGHTTVLRGIPVSTPTRMIFELAGSEHPERAARACDNVWSRRLTNHRLLHQMLDDWADHGRAGTVAMREILAARPPDYVPPASNLEGRFVKLVKDFGIGPFRRQVDLGGEGWVGRVDFLSERCPLVVEVLSEGFHAALFDIADDAARFAALDAAGFTTESVWDHELWGDPRPAMERIRVAEQRLIRRGAA